MAVVKMELVKFSCACGKKLTAQNKMGMHDIMLAHLRGCHPEIKELLRIYEEAKTRSESTMVELFTVIEK